MSRPRILVIGGGLAGLQAALYCMDEGADVTLLESRKRLGGATWSKVHRGLGFEIDNGQHVFMRCCDHYLGFLDRLGVRDRVRLQDRLEVPVARPNHRDARIARGILPAPAHLAPSLLRFPAISFRERVHAAITARKFSRLDPNDPALDDVSLGEWLRSQGESNPVIDRLWDLLIRPTLNLPAQDASLALAARVLRTGFLDTASGADIGWSGIPLGSLHAAAAEKALESGGVRVLMGVPVDRVDARGPGPVTVDSKGERFSADAVVLAVPHEVAARLLPKTDDFDPDGLARLPHSPIVNLHAVFDRKVTDHAIQTALDSDLQWIFDRTESAGLDRGQYITVALSAADQWLGISSSEMREIFEPQFRAIFPRSQSATIERFAVTIERGATYRATPGTRRVRPSAGSEIAGVFVAGAWTHTSWPATMEGAVRSGLAAARGALESAAKKSAGAVAAA